MLFRNLTLFRFSPRAAAALDSLETSLDMHRLRPCGPLEMSTRGFISPLGRDVQGLTHCVGAHTLLAVGGEDKLLPAAVVNAELRRKVRQIAENEGRRISGRERRKIKRDLMDQLLPRAFVRPSQHLAYADRKNGWLVLDTCSRKAAENMLTCMRQALGSFAAVPLAPEQAPRQLMTDWLRSGELPAGLSLAEECELRDPANASGAVARCRRQDLESQEIKEHLRNGKQVFQLGLNFDERMGFVLGEDMVLRKLRFFDAVTDELDHAQADADAELDARFALMTLELEHLFAKLEAWFKLPRPSDG